MTDPVPRPAPQADRDSVPFWEGVEAGELRVQQCDACGRLRWPPREICGRCRSTASTWRALSGAGRIDSWIVAHQVFHPAFADSVPYTVLQGAVDEQPDIQMIGLYEGEGEPAFGMAVRAVFVRGSNGAMLVHWTPSPG